MDNKIKLEDIKYSIQADSISKRNGGYKARRGFFYTFGKDKDDFVNDIKKVFPEAEIINSGEIWKEFNGRASLANSSHWYVEFKI